MNGKKASKKEKQEKVQMEAGKCKKSSKKVPVLWLVVVPKYTPFPCFSKFSQIIIKTHSKIAKIFGL